MKIRGVDIIGNKYSRWLVLSELDTETGTPRKFLCKCDCGTKKTITYSALVGGNSKSCGCYRDEKRRESIKGPYYNLKKAAEVYEMFYSFEQGRHNQSPIVYLHDNKVKLYSGIGGLPEEIYNELDYILIYEYHDFEIDSWMKKKEVVRSIQKAINNELKRQGLIP